MKQANELLNSLLEDARRPGQTIRREMERTGKKAVGCMLEFCPEELIYAAGMLPVGLWGGETRLNRAKEYYPAFFCAPIQENLELALQGAYDGVLSAVMVPILCDALKSAGQNWRIAVPHIPMIPVVYPQKRHTQTGQDFLRSELEQAREKLEQVCGHPITAEEIQQAIQVYNRYRLAMQEFARQAALHTDVVTPTLRHCVYQCGFYRDKGDYTAVVEELTQALKQLPERQGGRRVALTGIALDSFPILAALEENGLSVVADTLAQESCQINTLSPEGADPLARLAGWWDRMHDSSLALDREKGRVEHMVQLVRSGQADGVILATPSFCDPEEYDYPVFRAAFEREGIPHLMLEWSDRDASQQAKSRIQAFAELLSQ